MFSHNFTIFTEILHNDALRSKKNRVSKNVAEKLKNGI